MIFAKYKINRMRMFSWAEVEYFLFILVIVLILSAIESFCGVGWEILFPGVLIKIDS